MTWVTAGAAGVSALSSIFGAKKQKKQQQELLNYQRGIRLDPVTGQFGGISVNDGNVDAGAFGGLQDAFTGGAGSVLNSIDFNSGLPPEVAQALAQLRGNLSPNVNPMLGGLRRIGGQAGAVGNQALGEILGGGTQVQPELMAQLFGGAAGLAGDVGSSFNDVRDSTLANLRAQAQPENQRAVNSTLTNLFAQGRLGSSGGANIVGRLSEAQDQQDLGFQLAAGQEARNAATDTTNRFQSLLSGGLNLNQQSQNALAAAFGRFSGASGIGMGANTEAFNRSAGLEQTGFDRLLANLNASVGTAGLPTELQSQRVGLAQNLSGGAAGIQDLLMQAFGGALNKAGTATNVRLAGAGLNTQTMGAPGYSGSPVADAFAALGTGALGKTGLSDLLGRIFNKTTPTSPDRFQTA